MAVAAISDRSSHPFKFNASDSSTRGVGKNSHTMLVNRMTKQDTSIATASTPDAILAEPTEVESHDSEKAKGVLKLLESGHFRGVADVRLRINFFEELQAREQDRVQDTAKEGLADLTGTVTNSLQELLAPLDLDEETQTAINGIVTDFTSIVTSLADDFSSGTLADTDALANALQSAFTDLVGQIQSLLSPTDSDTETGDTVESLAGLMSTRTTTKESSTDSLDAQALDIQSLGIDDITGALTGSLIGVVEPTDDTQTVSLRDGSTEPVAITGDDLLTSEDPSQLLTEQDDALLSLADIFHQALSTFMASITTESSTTQLSEPNGNGTAYDKFLSEYQSLLGLISPTLDERA